MEMRRVSPRRFTTEPPIFNVHTEIITGFLSKFKGKTEEVMAGLADIHLDDSIPSETVGLKYMRQLVSHDWPPASHVADGRSSNR